MCVCVFSNSTSSYEGGWGKGVGSEEQKDQTLQQSIVSHKFSLQLSSPLYNQPLQKFEPLHATVILNEGQGPEKWCQAVESNVTYHHSTFEEYLFKNRRS